MAKKKENIPIGLYQNRRDFNEDLYSNYANWLDNGKVNSSTRLASFVNVSLDQLEKLVRTNPRSAIYCLDKIESIVEKTNKYYNRKNAVDADFAEYLLRKRLLPWQKEVFDDSSKKLALMCGRRTGKSRYIASDMIKHCLVGKDQIKTDDGIIVEKPRQAVYIGLTLEKAAGIMWEPLKQEIHACHIPVQKVDNGSYEIVFSNGASIKLWGNNSKAEREKLRGFDYSMVVIDEMQSQAGVRYLINSIVGPILKGRDGKLVLSGTAPISALTYWEDAYTDKELGFSTYHFTMEDNTTIPDYQHALEQVLVDNHWTKDNITFKREYLGVIAYDTNRLVFPHREYYDKIPEDFHATRAVIGVDFGFTDATAIAAVVTNGVDFYLFDEWKCRQADVTDIVSNLRRIIDNTKKTFSLPVDDIYAVADSSNGNIISEVYNRGVTEIRNAYKVDKKYQMATLREALSIGQLLIKKSGEFDLECDQTMWKTDEEKGSVIYEIDDNNFHPDMADAVRYAYNELLSMENM